MNICIVGAGGRMAGYYLRHLNSLRFSPSDLVLVETDAIKREKLSQLHPLSVVSKSLDILQKTVKIDCAIVVTNTPMHAQTVSCLLGRGVKRIFVEKPLAMDSSEVDMIRKSIADAEVYTAFLMNFSGALNALTGIMRDQGLHLVEAFVEWGKDRRRDDRPTPGDFEDELVHGFGMIENILLPINQSVRTRSINAELSLLPYADAKAQAAARASDASFPARPNSSSFVTEKVVTDRGLVLVGFHSSYMLLRQVRKVSFTLADASRAKTALGELEFDAPEGDILSIESAGGIARTPFKSDKLLSELLAFMDRSAGLPADPRLTAFDVSARTVELLDAVRPR